MRTLTAISFICLFALISAQAQQGSLDIKKPAGFASLEERHDDFCKQKDHMGYRVQVFAGTTKDAAFRVRNRLKSLQPGHSTYVPFNPPYYKVRIGNFRDRYAAYELSKKLSDSFSNCAIYPSEIEFFPPSVSEVKQKQASAKKD